MKRKRRCDLHSRMDWKCKQCRDEDNDDHDDIFKDDDLTYEMVKHYWEEFDQYLTIDEYCVLKHKEKKLQKLAKKQTSFQHLPIEVFNTCMFPKLKDREYTEGYLTRKDARNFAIVNKNCRQIVSESNAYFMDLSITSLNRVRLMSKKNKQNFILMLGEYNVLQFLIHFIKFPRITDVTALQNVHTLDLSNCTILTDVSPLRNVHTLKLQNCFSVSDVSALRNVNTLDLSSCHKITDISALSGVKHLNLRNCRGITDVSALGNVRVLNLQNCKNVTDVSMLGNIYDLSLNYCVQIKDVSGLKNVSRLYLRGCVGITDISMLGNVQVLDLSLCTQITDVSMLRKVRALDLRGCDHIINF